MNKRKSIEELIQSGIDDKLTSEERQELNNYLESNPEASKRFDDMVHQSSLIAKSVPTPSVQHLRSLMNNAKSSRSHQQPLRIAASIAIFTVGIGLGYVLPKPDNRAGNELVVFAEQARAAHALYVSEVLHPVEVAATERDHLQTWLSNRLGAAIIAPQLGETGYTLIGGRLLPAGDNASALFMYENENGDRLSLLSTHGAAETSQSFRFDETEGYLTIFWQDGPWQYSLVGALERDPMDQIAREIHEQLI